MTTQLRQVAQDIYTQTKTTVQNIENLKKSSNLLAITILIKDTLTMVNSYKFNNRSLTTEEKETVVIDATRLLLVDIFGENSPAVQTYDEVGATLVSASFSIGGYFVKEAEVIIDDIKKSCSCFGKKK
jgi:hypothetical protein